MRIGEERKHRFGRLPVLQEIEGHEFVEKDDYPECHLVGGLGGLVAKGALREKRRGPVAQKLQHMESGFRGSPSSGFRSLLVMAVDKIRQEGDESEVTCDEADIEKLGKTQDRHVREEQQGGKTGNRGGGDGHLPPPRLRDLLHRGPPRRI